MARQAETERERRAKIISAEGEFQAAENSPQASWSCQKPLPYSYAIFKP